MGGTKITPYVTPSVAEFKTYFNRDFPYGSDIETTVTDTDIAKAMLMVNIFLNQNLFPNQAFFTQGYLLLAAHFLVMNLRASSQGISGSFTWLATNKAVGNVSEGFQIPDRILANPELAILSQTRYGAEFLFLILPLLTANTFIVLGRTLP